jgi:spermidine synthase
MLAQNRAVILGTCFLEGASVLVVEIAGARSLAPFYGTSLVVWTSQITATLLFLALGYRLGGFLCRSRSPWHVSTLFWCAGLWLSLFPLMRNPILGFTWERMDLAAGSLMAAILMFGVPLLCYGAISPVLIEHWNQRREGAGSAAGTVFFVNTLGGLAGAWVTALVLVPGFSMRVSMTATGLASIALGVVWFFLLRPGWKGTPALVVLVAVAVASLAPSPLRSFETSRGTVNVIDVRRGWVGLIQVLENPKRHRRSMLIDGVTQGGIDTRYGYSSFVFAEYLNVMAHRFHPDARRALVLGLGPGVIARQLVDRGLEVEAVELDPAVAEVARGFFGLPDTVTVHEGDAREVLPRIPGSFDLVLLDTFTGENLPWHVMTREGLAAIRAKLHPGGRLVVNAVGSEDGASPGLERLEATARDVFGETRVFVEPSGKGDALVQSVLVAGADLEASDAPFPGRLAPAIRREVRRLREVPYEAPAHVVITTDDHSDLDYVDRELRARWRETVMSSVPAGVLAD